MLKKVPANLQQNDKKRLINIVFFRADQYISTPAWSEFFLSRGILDIKVNSCHDFEFWKKPLAGSHGKVIFHEKTSAKSGNVMVSLKNFTVGSAHFFTAFLENFPF